MKQTVAAIVFLLFLCLAQAVQAGGIKILKNEEIVMGDRDDWIRTIDDPNLQDGYNPYITNELRRDYEDKDAIAVCDVNGDGIDEIVLGDAGENKVYIMNAALTNLANLGQVGFENQDDLACGDVDGDGKEEVVIADASRDSIIVVHVEEDWRVWGTGSTIPSGFDGDDRVAVGDVNGDGKSEILIADCDDNRIHIFAYESLGVREISSFEVKYMKDGRWQVGYDHEDEITAGDINGDGIDEIIYGNGYDTHKIYVYSFNGSILLEFDASFDSSDELAAGDVNMDGIDEIIKGDDNTNKIHIYDSNGYEIASINVDYKNGEGIAVGDVDGDSLVLEEVSCQDTRIAKQIIAVINAPPRHSGVNYNPQDPMYTNYFVEYKNRRQEQTGLSLTTVHDFAFSSSISASFSILGISKSSFSSGMSKMWKMERYRGDTRTITVAEGLKTEYRDFAIAATYDVRVCEFKVLRPPNLAIIGGQQQYVTVTIPKGSPLVNSVELVNPQDYTNNGIRQIHTVGNILTYPASESGLVNYEIGNKVLSRGFTVGTGVLDYYYSQESSSIEQSKKETSLKTYVSFSQGFGFMGNSLSVSLRGDYGTQTISTAKLSFTEQTDIHVFYGGNTNFVSDTGKMYEATFVIYYDSITGCLVIDWLVPSHGNGFITGYGGVVRPAGQLVNANNTTQIGNIGGLIWGGAFIPAFTDSPYIFVENTHAKNDSEIRIPINVQNAKDIRNMDIELKFNPSILNAKKVESGTLTQNSLLEWNIGSSVKIAFVETNGINGNGTIAVVEFKVVGKPSEESPITLSASGNDLSGKSVNFTIGNGIFRVDGENELAALKGDCNGDGKLTSVDALMALQMAVGRIATNLIADMNNDSKVTSADAAEILDSSTMSSTMRATDVIRGFDPGIKQHQIVDYMTRR